MNKICPQCRIIVAGGLYCPDCSRVELLDVADPQNKPYLAGKGAEIKSLYDARAIMVLTLLSIFAGLVSGVAIFAYSKAEGWGVKGQLLALLALVGVPFVTGYSGLWFFRWLRLALRELKKQLFRIPRVRAFLVSYNRARR